MPGRTYHSETRSGNNDRDLEMFQEPVRGMDTPDAQTPRLIRGVTRRQVSPEETEMEVDDEINSIEEGFGVSGTWTSATPSYRGLSCR